MTGSTMKYALLQNLLERLEADARSERPLFRGVVSDAERNQLRELLHQVEAIPEQPASVEQDAGDAGGGGDTPRTTEPTEYSIDETVLGLDGSPEPEWMLCLDFGTAKSKAFAWKNDTEEPLDLPLGKLDQDLDDAIYPVSSSVWIDDDGLMFAGSEAVKRGALYGESVRARQRIDSIKQEISQIDPEMERRVRDDLLRRSVRRLKESLFKTGRISERLSNDQLVELTEQEFLDLEGISTFTENIRRTVQEDLLDKVHESWGAAAAPDKGSFKLILTGGGCDLPMIRDLAKEQWTIGNRRVRCHLVKSVPDFVADELGDEFAREYPQLAVAMGGAMPLLLDERRALEKWAGDAPKRGSVERPPGSGWTG